MPYSLIVDLLVAVLLVVTIGYAIVLNKRLGKLRRDKTELEKLASTFGQSTVRAEESIEKLKNAAELLQERMEKAVALRDDLAFLIDRGGQAADSLEDLVRETRDRMGVGARPGVRAGGGASKPRPAPSVNPTDAADDGDADDTGDAGDDEPRSEAERELLKAIRSAG